MIMDLFLKSETFVFLLLAIVYVLGKKSIETHERRHRRVGDEEFLAWMAADRKCSEYDLFLLAAGDWQVANARVEGDFKQYLMQGIVPHYVRDFVRKNRCSDDGEKCDHINPGGKLPASWSA